MKLNCFVTCVVKYIGKLQKPNGVLLTVEIKRDKAIRKLYGRTLVKNTQYFISLQYSMADDIEKGLSGEEDINEDAVEDGINAEEGVVPIDDEDDRTPGFTSGESTPEHLLTERTPLTKSGSKSNDIELQVFPTKEKRRLTKEVVNNSLNYV